MFAATTRRFTLCALAALAPLSTTQSATLRVPARYPTIASAIALAGPGDTIRISAGLYSEQLVIPPSKAGLQLKGAGNVLIDPTGVGPGAALTIEAPNVTIESVTIRHATNDGGSQSGVGVLVMGAALRTELRRVSVLRCESSGITIWAPETVVTACRITGCLRGIVSYQPDGRIQGCDIRLVKAGGILVLGDRTKVLKNEVHGIEVGTAITVFGIDSVAEQNTVSNTGTGLRLYDRGALARKNVISGCTGIGLYLASPSGRAEQNRITDCVVAGALVNGASQSVLMKNQVKGCGDGFIVDADEVTLHDNSALRNAGDGFRMLGNRAVLIDNLASGNLVDGFDVEAGVGHELTRNVALENHGEGIENNAAATLLRMNNSRKNRLDLAMDAAPALFDNNVYRTGGPDTLPETD